MKLSTDSATADTSITMGPPDDIDWSVLDAMKALQKPDKPDVRRKLMSVYIASAPPLMESIKAAVAAGDALALKNAAHSLKSSSLSIGALTFGRTCGELEQRGRDDAMANAPTLLVRAEMEFIVAYSAFLEALEQNR
jgi:HPt (histidine-containing phosphotransfer) domain-containing protein